MLKRIALLLSILFLAVSCGTGGKIYRIAMDPNWYPLNFEGKEPNIFAFSNELLVAIGNEEGVLFERVSMDWDNLILGLKENQYDGMLSAMTPRIFLESIYDFSDPFLHIGPVLVIKSGTKVSAVDQMEGKEVAVDSLTNEALLIERFPGVIVQYYTTIPEGFDEILAGYIDGVLVNYLQATSYIRDLYYGKVKIATPPLNDAGLRLVTINDSNAELVELFNRGLEKLRHKGTLEKLLKKWDLN